MQILHYNNIDFNIDANGNISRRSTWHVMPDENSTVDSEWADLRGQVQEWAGNPGDAWRLPGTDSASYTEDANYLISEVSCKSMSRYMYEVTYTGHKKHLSAEISGRINEQLNNAGEHSKSATWLIHADSLSGWLPEIGDVLSWAGSDFLCEDIQMQKRADNEWEVKLSAKDMSVMMIGNPDFSYNSSHESIRRAKWRVGLEAYEDFIASRPINSDASAWAGNGYYISDIQVAAYGKIAYYITLEARYAETRLLDIKRYETFDGYDENGNINKVVSWTGRWRVHRDNLSEFENRAGESAEDWTGTGTLVTKVTPTRITDLIYEISMEARVPEESGSAALDFNLDDRSNLGSRTDIICREVDFMLSVGECGWFRNSLGQYEQIPDWDADKLCPFLASEALAAEMIEAKLKCVLVSKAIFKKGRSKAHVRMNLDWSMSSRIESSVAGISGCWLKQSFDTEELFDNEGKRWTKIIRSYMHSPAGFYWNPSYGGHQ
ncbi:MAG: hypothetical protein PHV82_16590 [Victivallaceae bacterium]|nr:hypothetical protein [Victivallaceae bacterium]